MLALAKRSGFPMSLSAEAVDTGMLTPIGPYVDVPDTASYRINTEVPAQLVRSRRVVGKEAAEPRELRERLETEVEKILDAGHLRPWPFMMKCAQGWTQPGFLIWRRPGEILYVLAEVAPLCNEGMRTRIHEYLRRERKDYPPENTYLLPFDHGALRMRHRPFHKNTLTAEPGRDNRFLKFYTAQGYVDFEKLTLLPMEHYYYLSKYCNFTGKAECKDSWGDITKSYARHCHYQDWASLGWYARASHKVTAYQNVTQTRTYEYPFGGGGVIDVNNTIAGLIGLCRMARRVNDTEQLNLYMGHLGRMLALRVGMAYFPSYCYNSGLLSYPEHGDRLVGDVFVREDWDDPLDDTRQVFFLNQFGANLAPFSSYAWDLNLGTMHGIVPELGVFLREYTLDVSRAYLTGVENNWPDWYAAYSEMFYSHETAYGHCAANRPDSRGDTVPSNHPCPGWGKASG